MSEHLDEVERDREQSEAERWQLAEVYRTLERRRRGRHHSTSRQEIDFLFVEALEAAKQKRGT